MSIYVNVALDLTNYREKIKLNYLINDNDSLSNEKNKVYKKI